MQLPLPREQVQRGSQPEACSDLMLTAGDLPHAVMGCISEIGACVSRPDVDPDRSRI